MINVFIQLMYRVGFIIMIAFVFSKTAITKNFLKTTHINTKRKISMGFFFALLSIIGTYTGISFNDAIVNTRVIGAVVGGLIGGPITGLIAGLIAGTHRFFIDITSFTSLSCAISTTLEGLIAGFFSKKFYESKDKVLFSIALGIVAEFLQMVVILLVAKPFDKAMDLVSVIALPMIFMNSIGIGLFINIIENIKKIGDLEGAFRSYQTLLIADKTLGELRSKLDYKSSKNIAKIIYDATDFDAVSITDNRKILAHIGLASDHHLTGQKVRTNLTKNILKNETTESVHISDKIQCSNDNCPLKKALIVPLRIKDNHIGTLKLYKGKNSVSSNSDIELAKGLGNIFSTQLELSLLEYQKNLRVKAELHALQAQINPHFLFNAINTIVSLIRTNQEKARETLIYLSDYFRRNMNNDKDLILLEEELNHVNAYLKIEKARFEDRLELTINNEVSLPLYVPPLIIQPIVENAVKHGILNNKNGGKIKIDLYLKNNSLNIIISDNGIGISNSDLLNIKAFNSNSVGLNNVYKRLKTLFHEKASLEIISNINEGTTVKIKMPLLNEINEIGGLND